MSELTQEQYQDPEFFNPDRWVDFTSTEMVLLDPANGNPYKPGEPPEWIAADPRLVHGYELLGKVGTRHELTIAYGIHDTAQYLDRSIFRPNWYEKEVAKKDAVGFERVGWSRADWGGLVMTNELQEHIRPAGADVSFVRRRNQAALDNQKPLFSYDVELTSQPLEVAMTDIANEYLRSMQMDELGEMRFAPQIVAMLLKPGVLQAIFTGSQYLRDWYIPSKYMLMTEELAEDIGESPRVLITIGSAHQAVGERMRQFGLKPKEVFLRGSNNSFAGFHSGLNKTGRTSRKAAGRLGYC